MWRQFEELKVRPVKVCELLLFSHFKNWIAKNQISQATAKMSENTLESNFHAESKYAVRINPICTHVYVINGQRVFTFAHSAAGVFTPIRIL